MNELTEAVRLLSQERGISKDLIRKTVEQFLLVAYEGEFGRLDNAVVRFSDDDSEVTLYARKQIVEEIEDPVSDIYIKDALRYSDECEIGDDLLIEVDPHMFNRSSIQRAKQSAKETLRDIQKDTLFSEFGDKVGEMIIGYYRRERGETIFVDLGNAEGMLPKRFQSPRESYRSNDRIKVLIYEVTKTPAGLQIVLSRTHTDFVCRIFELEVPEIYDHTVEIYKIVREPGYRTKIAVYSNREDVDPVGACVGVRGVRIQAVVKELEGEKIDILKYENDPVLFIKNALSPATVSHVHIVDATKRQALVIVSEDQLSFAIGKQGLNVRLANRLVDWNIDVKTEKQVTKMDLGTDSTLAVSQLFGEPETKDENEVTLISELPTLSTKIVETLRRNGIELIEDLLSMEQQDHMSVTGLTSEEVSTVRTVLSEMVEIVDDSQTEGDAESAQD